MAPVCGEKPGGTQPLRVAGFQVARTGWFWVATDNIGQATGIQMDWEVVMYPLVDDKSQLTAVYITMDSGVLRNFKSKQGNLSPEQAEAAEKRYVSSVYFHTIFLYSITKSRQYEIKKSGAGHGFARLSA